MATEYNRRRFYNLEEAVYCLLRFVVLLLFTKIIEKTMEGKRPLLLVMVFVIVLCVV